MDNELEQLNRCLAIAEQLEAAWHEKPTPATFRMWRDAQEVAVKWAREVRRNGIEGEEDTTLADLLAG